ncbi:hypothetical protein BLS_004080 [Venturia inaequalis]|uniref:Vacuolar import and degradation protein-domain-containing protein n=1 Tax=Venturia inaequalis TaxID=5025 RepID=A0A8H3V2S3_VENIN|nr:hypothetical protein BLS_004080 [Venturia inaequalis]KAE9980001.1 hypothetical protein EG327_006735 [Venturia inaequalis]
MDRRRDIPSSHSSNSNNNSNNNSEHTTYLTAIRQIEAIPVPDLASTLTTNHTAEDEANEANISFLRTQIDPQDEWRAQNAERESSLEDRDRSQRMSSSDRARRDRVQRDRLQRVLARLNRLHDPAYGDRVPSHNSLYDWSPGSEGEDNGGSEEADLQAIQRELRRQQPTAHPEVLRVLAQAELDQERERRSRVHATRFSSTAPTGNSRNESSLRSAATLQAIRRHPRFSTRSAQHMERYIMDRSERQAIEAEEARTRLEENRATEQLQRRIGEIEQLQRRIGQMSTPALQSDPRPRIRRAILQDPAPEPSDRSSWLPSTVKYLANLRYSRTEEDGFMQAVDFHLATKENFIDTHDDFLLDVYSLPPTHQTSLLVPGAVFEGQQRAHTPGDFLSSHEPISRWETEWRASESANSTQREYQPRFTLDEVSSQWASSNSIPPHAQRTRSSRPPGGSIKADFWPVKVRIHAVDYEKMTLAATMEAYDVPSQGPAVSDLITNLADDIWPTTGIDHNQLHSIPAPPPPPPKKEERKSITTYLEGEILDFKNFTFKTESFKSSLDNDATYWRKLEPFKDFTDEELIGRLTSKGYLEHLSQSYILMRWKERCFVRDSPFKTQLSPSLGGERGHAYGSSSSAGSAAGGEARDAVDFYEAVEMPDGFTGLTISGFYYVCMRRGDGAVEGLYCDPQSSPYQRLTLERRGEAGLGRFPCWEFK